MVDFETTKKKQHTYKLLQIDEGKNNQKFIDMTKKTLWAELWMCFSVCRWLLNQWNVHIALISLKYHKIDVIVLSVYGLSFQLHIKSVGLHINKIDVFSIHAASDDLANGEKLQTETIKNKPTTTLKFLVIENVVYNYGQEQDGFFFFIHLMRR